MRPKDTRPFTLLNCSMTDIRFLPTFAIHADQFEVAMVNDLQEDLVETGAELGADYVYVCKNLTNGTRPLTFAYYAQGGKFLARRTPNTVLA
jgi:hypothetical protein